MRPVRHAEAQTSRGATFPQAWSPFTPHSSAGIAPDRGQGRRQQGPTSLNISNPDVQGYRLEDISAPTLIISARDDAMSAHDNSVHAAAHIPGSHLVSFDQGGHLLLDHEDDVRHEVAKFLQA
jgi:pimeloyl-ACP methyl ester carboxylesterase